MIIEYQRNILADTARNQAFYQALQHVIVPGKSALADVGSGTGLLGFLASKLGAKSVYMYEYSPVIKLSQKLARQNRVQHCHFIHDHSSKVAKPIAVDIIVSETLGNYAYEENIIETIEDAKRFLKPGGIIIPQRITQYVAVVIAPRFYQDLCSWDKIGFDLDFSSAKTMTLNNLYVRKFAQDDLLEGRRGAQRWDTVDFSGSNKSLRKGGGQWQLDNEVMLYGAAVWWECELITGIKLSTSPFVHQTHWEQLYFPVLQPILCQADDIVRVNFESDTRYQVGVNLKWQFTLQRGTQMIMEQSLDMRKGDVR
ncbi:MAG: 50S ribosomal protein L11 methyltransferase [Gammaproteobacteria bacterium]|nr:50S ribosomal protein L11 methyltransferase [Gammaproteobacteria bacterium]